MPIPSCTVFSDSRIDIQSRTIATASLPAVAVDEIRAMAREGPCVAEVEDDWRDFGEFGQNPQVEIPSMEIVAVDDICLVSNNLCKLSTAGERPFVASVPPVGKSRWIGETVEASGEEPHARQGAFT